MNKIEFGYDALYLKKHLQEVNDPRQDDDQFIMSRVDAAADEFDRVRLAGGSPDAAQEAAHKVLMDDL